MLTAALSTAHKVGLGLAGLTFIVFAVLSAIVIPRSRPDFPGRRLALFIAVTVLLFAGMLTAVVIFGAENEDAGAGEHAPPQETVGAAQTTAGEAQVVHVAESEFKIVLTNRPKALTPGSYEFAVVNRGKTAHNLVVRGPQANNASTSNIEPNGTAKLNVGLVKGTYTLFCSIPGHEEAGMKLTLKVTRTPGGG